MPQREALFRGRAPDLRHARVPRIEFIAVVAKTVINKVPSGPMPFEWTLNPYRGCSHACSYCFARVTHTFMDMNAGRDFESKIGFSIGSLDEDVWRRSELGTPHPRERIKAVARLAMAGVPVNVMVAPILLHLRPVVREEYMAWLQREYSDLVTTYESMYARGSYAPKEARASLGRTVAQIEREERRRLGITERQARTHRTAPPRKPAQLRLEI
jgi:DNA repair photolyase